MRRAALAALCLIVPSAMPVIAVADNARPGRLGALIGVRHGIGSEADELAYGWGWGLAASWQPMALDQRWGWRAGWTMTWSYFGKDGAADIVDSIALSEMSLLLGVRFQLTPAAPRFLTASLGGAWVRSNAPLPPDDDRAHIGPVVELGYEQFVFQLVWVGVSLRGGPLALGPNIGSGFLHVGVPL